MKFKIGDRVIRRADVYDLNSLLLHGEVVACYSQKVSDLITDVELWDEELYAVQWDGGKIQRGFFSHGLDAE